MHPTRVQREGRVAACGRRSRRASGRWTSLEREWPGAPAAGEVVLRPEVVGVCGSDVHLFHGRLSHALPRIQGHEISAVVEAVGPGVDRVAPGRPRRRVAGAGLRRLLPVQHRARERVRQPRHHRRRRRRRPAGAPVRAGVPGFHGGRPATRRDRVRRAGVDRRAHRGACAGDRRRARRRPGRRPDRPGGLPRRPRPGRHRAAGRPRAPAPGARQGDGRPARRLRGRRRPGRRGARVGGRRRRAGDRRHHRRPRRGAHRLRADGAGRPARARGALRPGGQPPPMGVFAFQRARPPRA